MEFVPCSQCPELAPKGADKCPACGGPLAQATDGAAAPRPADVAPPVPTLQPALPPETQAKAQALEDEIKAKPTAKALYLKLAELYESASRRDLALATLKRLLEIEPGNTYVKHRLSLLERPPEASSRTAAALPIPRIAPSAPPPRRKWPKVAGASVLAIVIGVAAWFVFFPATRRIVTLAESARTPQWSPTGDRVAFISDRQGRAYLTVYNLRKNTTREVAAIAGGGAEAFAWSPDGQMLAYVGPDEAGAPAEGVFVAAAEGAAAASRLGTGRIPQWSPDGSWVAFACEGSGPATEAAEDEGLDLGAPSLAMYKLCLASLTGSNPRQIPLPAPLTAMAFSPDGSRLVLALETPLAESAPSEASVPEHPDGELVALADGAIAGRPTNVLEGRQGLNRELEARAYDKQRGGVGPGVPVAMTNLYVVNADGAGLVQLTTDHRAALRTWASDGRILFIATLAAGDGAELLSMQPDGTDRQSLFKVPVEANDASAIVPARDLSRVIFPARVKEANEMVANLVTGETAVDLHVVEKGQSGVRRLVNKHPFKQRFALSPDGARIVYEVRDLKSGHSELWLMRF